MSNLNIEPEKIALHIEYVINLAKKAVSFGDFPVGAIVVQGDDIIGEGFNQKESLNDPIAHAEILAIKTAAVHVGDWRLTNCTLISSLEPCPMCLGAVIQARINHIIYLAKDLRWGACGTIMDFSAHSSLNHRCTTTYIENDTVVEMMTLFFKNKR